jgi:hypothetical protein
MFPSQNSQESDDEDDVSNQVCSSFCPIQRLTLIQKSYVLEGTSMILAFLLSAEEDPLKRSVLTEFKNLALTIGQIRIHLESKTPQRGLCHLIHDFHFSRKLENNFRRELGWKSRQENDHHKPHHIDLQLIIFSYHCETPSSILSSARSFHC